jgi:thiamine biosynthesis protein ThiI
MVPILKIQQKIMAETPNKLWVILFRRAMIRIASRIADNINAPALISGESVGQVASQTLSNIRATADAADRPILRPLCGRNKEDIVNLARNIGTYEISIEPYEDCCSFFVPIHPETKADLDYVIKVESTIDFDNLFDETMENTTISTIYYPDYIKEKKKKREKIDD